MPTLHTPLGPLVATFTPEGLRTLGFADPDGVADSDGVSGPPDLQGRLDAWFAGDLASLDDVALDLVGTEFQRQVWAALRRVPPGASTTYGDIARELGSIARAVGGAVASNPVALVVPCHRVVRADGGLGGYRWGAHRKAALRKLEQEAGGQQVLW